MLLYLKTKQIKKSDILALPGVGAFPKGISNLKKSGLDNFIKEMNSWKLLCLGYVLGCKCYLKAVPNLLLQKDLI